MSVNSAVENKGDRVLDELRIHFNHYLEQPGSMSLRALGEKCDLTHVSLRRFRDGGKLYFDSAVLIADAIGFDLSKSLKTAGSSS